MTPNKNARTYDEILQQSIEEAWGFVPVRCPHCGNGAVSYFPKDAGLWNCECDVCGEEWLELVEESEDVD